ncbi:circadian clock-controlled protein daywake-like [Bicyclus anynana]|uniref:Circadian clock-controlled protein daywake-like n=1 Tax=Bicyclus anynana TaxID=110368 RepID=A0ABM3LTL8_BICAN|nr:circadian clock-controlled protein daywake-like [Bicyclus anynana]
MKYKNCSFIICIVLFFVSVQNISAIKPLPHIKCFLQDSSCLKMQAQAVLKEFVKGIPELGIKRLDKMELDYIEVRANKLHYEMRNTILEGLNNTIIDDISIDMAFKIMRVSFHTNLVVNCDYNCDGEVFGLPVIGNGTSQIIMNNLQVEIILLFDVAKNDQGKDIISLKKYFYGADAIDGVHHYFGNLFNGDLKLSGLAHAVINKNWRTIVANYGRFFTGNFMDDMFEVMKKYMRTWPIDVLAYY